LKVQKYTARNFGLKMFEFVYKFKLLYTYIYIYIYIYILLGNQDPVLTVIGPFFVYLCFYLYGLVKIYHCLLHVGLSIRSLSFL